MQHVSGIEDKAKAAHGKKAAYGTDVDLESFESDFKEHEAVKSAEDLPSEVKKAALDVGVKLDDESAGAYVQMAVILAALGVYGSRERNDLEAAFKFVFHISFLVHHIYSCGKRI